MDDMSGQKNHDCRGGALMMWAGRFGLRILVLKPQDLGPKGLQSGAAAVRPSTGPSRTGGLESRLSELKRLHEAGLIDDGAYQARQLELLKEL